MFDLKPWNQHSHLQFSLAATIVMAIRSLGFHRDRSEHHDASFPFSKSLFLDPLSLLRASLKTCLADLLVIQL
jgi:hypothetical protein